MTVITEVTQQQTQVEDTSTQTQVVEVPEWLKGVDASLVAEPSVKNMKTMNDLVKSFVSAQKFIGADKVQIPPKNATKEQWGEFYKKVGHPESIDKYNITFKEKPTIEQGALEVLKKASFENGILPHQAQALYEQMEAYSSEASKRALDASKEVMSSAVKDLQAEWGDAYTHKLGSAVAMAKKFGGDEFIAHLEKTGMGNDTRLIKFLASIGDGFQETPPKGLDANTPDGYNNTLDAILNDYNHPYYKTDHVGHRDAVKQVEFLMQKKYK